jgi:GT2 family glycosyltransferase
MSSPMVRVVVVNFNGGDLTLRCLHSILATQWPQSALRVVLVDNASADGVVARVRNALPEVEIVESAVNLGFAGGANLGLRDRRDARYVALVNNDAAVDPGWLAPLVDALEHDPALGAASPKILYAGQALIDNVGLEPGPWGRSADRGHGEPDDGRYDTPADVFAWCGAAVLLRSAYLDDVGLFDDRLFLYCEDLELAWRGRERGWRYRAVPASVVRHVHAATTGEGSERQRFYSLRNSLLVAVRHASAATALTAVGRSLGALAVAAVRRPHDVRLRARAFAGFLRLAPAMLAARRADRAASRRALPMPTSREAR